MIKSIVTRTEWNVYTLHEDVLKRTENPFEDIAEPNLKGRKVLSRMKFNSPLKLVIGSDDDQPFSEGRWPFSAVLRKRDSPGKLLEIKSLTLEVPLSGPVVIAQPCEFKSFDRNTYSLGSDKLDDATEILNKKVVPIDIHCTLSVGRLDSEKQVPERSVIQAEVEFDFESVFTIPITIFSGVEREELE